jgi:hypothetical protein
MIADHWRVTCEAATSRIMAERTTTETWFEAGLNGSHEGLIQLSLTSLGRLPHLSLYKLQHRVVETDFNSDWTAVAVQKVFIVERRMIDAVEPLMTAGTFDPFSVEPILFIIHLTPPLEIGTRPTS